MSACKPRDRWVRGDHPFSYPHRSYMADLLRDKVRGIDCDENDSAAIMRWFDVHATTGGDALTGSPEPFSLTTALMDAFPLEYDQWCDEARMGYRDRHAPSSTERANASLPRIDKLGITKVTRAGDVGWQVWVPRALDPDDEVYGDSYWNTYDEACTFVRLVLSGLAS